MIRGQAVPRHLVFVLDNGDVVVQRGANVVESLKTRKRQVFSDFDRDHDVTNAELEQLIKEEHIAGWDEFTVWLPFINNRSNLTYYFLDTKLSPPYLDMVVNLLRKSGLENQFTARRRMGRVAIMGRVGDPFNSLSDAESALTLLEQALGKELVNLSVANIEINPRRDETGLHTSADFLDLIRETPVTTLADRTTLIVDAHPEVLEDVSAALETLGIQVRTAITGELALEILMDEEPDLVLVDLSLPDMHGYEVIAKIKKDPLTANTPIVAVSNLGSEADIVFALHVAKVDDYMVKPINPKLLRQRVIALLNQFD